VITVHKSDKSMSIIQSHLPAKCYSNQPIEVDGCVIHYISAVNVLPEDPFNFKRVMQLLKDYKLSAHYYIDRDGEVHALTPKAVKAYHAGKSHFNDRDWCNNFMLGIELAGGKDFEYEDVQIDSLVELLNDLIAEYGFSQYNIVGHDAVRSAWNIRHPDSIAVKKVDPGEHFPWDSVMERLM